MDRRSVLVSGLLAGALPLASARADEPTASELPGKFVAALNAGDMKAFAELFSDDYVNHQSSAAAPAASGVSAKKATVAFFANRVDSLNPLKVTIETSLAQADLCAASFIYEGIHSGFYYGVAPTGRKLRFSSCDIFRLSNGKIVEHWGMGDIAGVLAQLKG